MVTHPNKIYAFTIVKEYKDRFKQERDMSHFKSQKVEMDELEYSMFTNTYWKYMLGEFNFGIGVHGPICKLILTRYEEEAVENFSCQCECKMEKLYMEIMRSKLKKSVKKKLLPFFNLKAVKRLPDGSDFTVSRINMLTVIGTIIPSLRKDE